MEKLLNELRLLIAASINRSPYQFTLRLELTESSGLWQGTIYTETMFDKKVLCSFSTNPNTAYGSIDVLLRDLVQEVRKSFQDKDKIREFSQEYGECVFQAS